MYAAGLRVQDRIQCIHHAIWLHCWNVSTIYFRDLQIKKAPQLRGGIMRLLILDTNGRLGQYCQCLCDSLYFPFETHSCQVSRNTLSVAEAVHESSARNSEIVPGHSKQPSWRLRITPIIKTGCGQAESRNLPLIEIVPLAQGFALFKKRGSTWK